MRYWFFVLILTISSTQLFSQGKHIGDLYEFPDGSKGIVCYVDPQDSRRGWAVALNDLSEQYAIWTSASLPVGLNSVSIGPLNWSWGNDSWNDNGNKNTKILADSKCSPAADEVQYYNGWYIPDAKQMKKIFVYVPFIKSYFEKNGGEALNITTRTYWTSSSGSTTTAYSFSKGSFTSSTPTAKYYIRPVRDFGDEAVAYWVDPYKADSTITGSMKVSPKTTTTYDAVVVYGKDTFRLKGTATPCHKYDKDTLYELVCRADTLYNSKKDSHFTGLDISVVKNDYYTYRDTLQTVKGCDSVITLKLLVVDDCENVYADSICPIETSYSILDTTFLPGTVSGIYARPGKKFVGSLWIDTVSYIDLTVFTPPTVSINDLVETCPLVGSQVLGATITDGKTPYTYTWSTVGTGITLSDASIPAPTVTIPTTCGVSYTIKLDVIDGNGCKADQATKIVTVKSTDVPVINTTFASADLGCNPGTIIAPTFTVTDDCEGTNPLPNDSVTVTGPTNSGCSYTQSWTAHYTDACGNKAKDSTITYTWTVDTEKPVIASTAVSGDLGCNPSTITAPTFTVTDNCEGSFTLTADSVTVTGPTNTGCSYTQSWTAHYTDACGNKAKDSTITYTWTVDNEKPVIASTAVSGDLGCNPSTITAPTFTVTDNCEGSFTLTADSVTVTGPTNTGCSYTQSWTAHYTDACGNKAKDSTITYTWTVDNEKPVIASTAVSGDLGCNPSTITAPTFTVTDNCEGSFTLTADSVTVTGPTNSGCSYTQSWTAHYTDACGNKAKDSTITYTWTVDNEKPVIASTAVSGDLGCNPSTITAPTFTVTDNCEGSFTLTDDSVTVTGPTNSGCNYTQSWTAHYTDACGNKAKDSTVTYTWTVDTEKPVIASTAVSGDLGCNPGTITAPTFTVTDNCEGSFTLNADSVTVTGPTNSGCNYTQSWTAHYTDACGNKAKDSTITYTWTVDNEKPVIASTAVSGDLGCNPSTITAPTFTVTDNCEGSFTLTADSVTVTGPTNSGCSYTQSWTAHYTDACGNKAKDSTITFTWTVDTDKPLIASTAVSGDLGCNPGTITAPTFTVTDNCEGSFTLIADSVTVTGPTNSGCSYTQSWTAHYTDACGNKAKDSTITYTWTVDNEKPVIASTAVSGDLGCNPGTITAPTFTVTDNCEGSFTLTDDSVTVTGPTNTGCSYTQSWTAHYTDACGNKAKDSTITYTWTESTTPTIITSLTDKDFSCVALMVAPIVSDFTVNDACDPSATVTLTEGPETVTGYVHSKTWTATYKNSCNIDATPVSITYKWKDATTVTITCPPNVYDTLDFGECEMKVAITKLGYPTTSITPPGTPFGVTNDFPADSVFSEGDNLVSWVIIDSVCGYTDTCFQHILITFPKCPDAVDCEGYIYHGVRIGCDCWTQRNLESTKYSDCTDIPCVYEYVSETHPNVTENVALYGRLYCYEAAIRDSADNGHGHIQGICPAGWYLPTPEKYEELSNYGTRALKYPSYWISADGINTTGFSALPAGYFSGSTGRFEGLLGETYFWSTSGTGASTKITICALFLGCNDIIFVPVYTGMGYSVRCIKEKEK